MPAPAEVNLTETRGDSWALTVTFTDEGGYPVDVSADSWRAEIKARPDDVDALAAWTVDDTDAAEGILVLTLAAADSADLPARVLHFDVEGTTGDVVRTWLVGAVEVVADVSRPAVTP